MKKTAVVIDMANVKRTQDKTTHLVCAATYYHRPRPCPRCCVTPADVPPIREAGVPRTVLKYQGPLVIQCLGTTEDPWGSPYPRRPIRRRPLLVKSKELEPGLKKRSGRRVSRAQSLERQVGKGRPNSHWQLPEVPMVADAP